MLDLPTPGLLELRWVLLFGIVALFLLLEWWAPLRPAIESKLHHVSTNLVITGGNSLLISLLSGGVVLFWSKRVESQDWGLLHHLKFGTIAEILISIVLLDLASYGLHRSNHSVPLLWRFHRGHHSDLDMDVTTSVRFHLGESLITNGFKAVSVLALGISPAGYLTYEMAVFVAGLYQHANFKMPQFFDRSIRPILVTSLMHWIHHSRRSTEHNKNFGVLFSGWDRLFGTYLIGVEQKNIPFGLDEYPKTEDVHILPFCHMPLDPVSSRIP